MPLVSASVAVNATATPLYSQRVPAGTVVYIANTDPSIDLLIGGSNVSRSLYSHVVNKNGGEAEIRMFYGDTLYGITGSGSTAITVGIMTTDGINL